MRAVRFGPWVLALALALNLVTAPFWLQPPSAAQGLPVLDAYGGHPGLKGTATGYFHAEKLNNRWWLIDPLGNAFYAVGASMVSSGGMEAVDGSYPYVEALWAKYGNPLDQASWANDTVQRLKAWGYNTIGPYSSPILDGRMPFIVDLAVLSASVNYTRSQNGGKDQYPILYEESKYDSTYRRYFFDVFDPVFITQTESYIAGRVSQGSYKENPYLIGYVADNEVPLWNGRCVTCTVDSPWLPGKTMADVYIAMPASAAGKQKWVEYLQENYQNNISNLNAAWGKSYTSFDELRSTNIIPTTASTAPDKGAFLGQIMKQYFKTIRDAIYQYDGNHMYLGSRLITCCGIAYAPEVYQQTAAYADVVTINYYLFDDTTAADTAAMKADLDAMYNTVYNGVGGQRPLMNTEFSFSGQDFRQSPIKNRNGAVLPTQEDRARAYANYQRYSAGHPGVVGTMWWSYFDPPSQGARHGGEDANLGLVDNNDDPYGAMMYRMAYENRNVYSYLGLPATQGGVLSGAFDQEVSEGSAATPLQPAVEPLASFTPVSQVYLPLIVQNYPYRSLEISYSASVPITQTTLTIYDGNGPHATQKRKIVSNDPLSAGTHSLTWDGLDQQGQAIADGWYYYVLTAVASNGSTEHAVRRLKVGQSVSDWQAYFFRYDAYKTMTADSPYTLALSVFNAGEKKWPSAEMSLTYRWVGADGQVVQGGQVPLPYDVGPSSSVVLTATLQAPGYYGNYTLKWDMVRGGTSFESLGGQPLQMTVTVAP